MTREQKSEVSSVAKFVSEDIQDDVYEEMESIFADDREGSIACDISIDLMKVQQAQVSFEVINDYVMMPEMNGRLNNILESLIYTQVSGKKFHFPLRLFDNVKGELMAVMNIFYFVLFYSTFLWIVGFHRAFILNGKQCVMPLVYPTEEGQVNEITWFSLQQNAFDALKKALVMQTILRMADLSQPFILQVDAFNDGLGVVLLQRKEGKKNHVAYASKKFKPVKRHMRS